MEDATVAGFTGALFPVPLIEPAPPGALPEALPVTGEELALLLLAFAAEGSFRLPFLKKGFGVFFLLAPDVSVGTKTLWLGKESSKSPIILKLAYSLV